jgi:hypothetical protein
MAGSEDRVHCPVCDAEYDPGVSICVDDGTLLVAGPAPEDEPGDDGPQDDDDDDLTRGRIEVVRLERPLSKTDAADGTPSDLFEQEEHPDRLRLAVMAKEDAPDLVSALEAEGIGARLGEETPDGGIEVIVHDTHLADAQAVLVDFTGDPSLVDDVQLDPPSDGVDRGGMLRIFDGATDSAEAGAERISGAGMDVRMELFMTDEGVPHGSLWVAPDDLNAARGELGIAR